MKKDKLGKIVVSIQHKKILTPEHYIERERKAEYRSEYLDGNLLDKTGASENHNLIVGNIAAAIHQQFRKSNSEVYVTDMRLKVMKTSSHFYPYIVAVPNEPKFDRPSQNSEVNKKQ